MGVWIWTNKICNKPEHNNRYPSCRKKSKLIKKFPFPSDTSRHTRTQKHFSVIKRRNKRPLSRHEKAETYSVKHGKNLKNEHKKQTLITSDIYNASILKICPLQRKGPAHECESFEQRGFRGSPQKFDPFHRPKKSLIWNFLKNPFLAETLKNFSEVAFSTKLY